MISPIQEIYFSFVKANGITFRLASTERNLITSGGKATGRPLILFLHGFPESWYSWRHQLLFLKEKPFLAVAPDMRGYGSTRPQPKSVEAYTLPVLATDVLGIASELGYDKFILVGHDWGSQLAWTVSLLYPDHVIGVCGMSVPYAGNPKSGGLLTALQLKYGRCLGSGVSRDEYTTAKFHYILHHCLPHCAEEYNRNIREFIYRIYANQKGSGEIESGTPEYDIDGLMFPPMKDTTTDHSNNFDASKSPGLWKRLPRPKRLPKWLSQQDIDYFTEEFEMSGFHGPLCWYRALDLNVKLVATALNRRGVDDKIRIPSLFLIGENDKTILDLYGGKEKLISRVKGNLLGLTRQPIIVSDCGHWIQQEHFNFVNDELLQFFEDVLPSPSSRSQNCNYYKNQSPRSKM